MDGTPIHKWKLPGVPENFTLSVKREDLTGSTLSGNKVLQLVHMYISILFHVES